MENYKQPRQDRNNPVKTEVVYVYIIAASNRRQSYLQLSVLPLPSLISLKDYSGFGCEGKENVLLT
ncbi:MAG: hypothetical protein MR971_04960 [Bacteroidales bacterium]|nr:hypothetical protein [Bacteroidales bacterium]